MHIICGLGNPGEEYEHTRHNAGFDSVDALAEELRVNYWKNECGALTAKTTYKGEDLLHEYLGRSFEEGMPGV